MNSTIDQIKDIRQKLESVDAEDIGFNFTQDTGPTPTYKEISFEVYDLFSILFVIVEFDGQWGIFKENPTTYLNFWEHFKDFLPTLLDEIKVTDEDLYEIGYGLFYKKPKDVTCEKLRQLL